MSKLPTRGAKICATIITPWKQSVRAFVLHSVWLWDLWDTDCASSMFVMRQHNYFYSLKTQSGTEVSPIIWDGQCCPKPQSRLFQTGSTLRFFHQKMGIWHEVQVWYLRITDTELYTKMLCQSNKQNFGLILQVALGHFLVDASAVCVLARKLGLEQYQSLSWSFLVPWKSHLETYLRNFITASFNVVQINGLNSS